MHKAKQSMSPVRRSFGLIPKIFRSSDTKGRKLRRKTTIKSNGSSSLSSSIEFAGHGAPPTPPPKDHDIHTTAYSLALAKEQLIDKDLPSLAPSTNARYSDRAAAGGVAVIGNNNSNHAANTPERVPADHSAAYSVVPSNAADCSSKLDSSVKQWPYQIPSMSSLSLSSFGEHLDDICPLTGMSITSAFWKEYDRRVSEGGDMTQSRVILDAMVDDMLSTGSISGLIVEHGKGTFNDVLSNRNSLHPVVMAFVRAHIEDAYVCLSPQHIWLAALQGVSAIIHQLREKGDDKVEGNDPLTQRSSRIGLQNQVLGVTSSQYQNGDRPAAPDLGELWRVLRTSSDVPRTCTAAGSGHEIRLFPTDLFDRHPLYCNRGAAPIAMAAATSGHRQNTRLGSVDYGQIGTGAKSVSWQPNQRCTNPALLEAVAKGPGVKGMYLTGTIQSWSSLCMLTRQLKETYSGHDRGYDWWLHRMHLLCRDLADYFVAQDEFETGTMPSERKLWLSMALFTPGQSKKPDARRLDGWLSALFPFDNTGKMIHERNRWWVDWDKIPCGVDLLRASVGAPQQLSANWVNLYSGFIGVQQLNRSNANKQHRSRGQTRTLHGEELEGALGITQRQRDHAATLTNSREYPDLGQHLAANVAVRTVDDDRAIAPLIGWALDK